MDVLVHEDHEAASLATAHLIIDAAHRALERSGRFTLVLAGGTTPRKTYELLASPPLWAAMPWDRTHIFFGDERMVPPDHEWSNYRMARETLFDHVPSPKENQHRMQGEGEAQSAALAYTKELAAVFGDQPPRFDFILLGMGPDGHTASIFPGDPAITSTNYVTTVNNPPAAPKVDRLTLCLPVLNAARTVAFLATGGDKRTVLDKMLNTKTARHLFPAAMIRAEKTLLLTDQRC